MSSNRTRGSSQGGSRQKGGGGGGAGGDSNAGSMINAGQPLVPPRVDPIAAMDRFNPFHFHIDTDTKDTTDLRAAFAALQRDAFVASNLFVLDRAEVISWFSQLTDPNLSQQINEAKTHLNLLMNYDAFNEQDSLNLESSKNKKSSSSSSSSSSSTSYNRSQKGGGADSSSSSSEFTSNDIGTLIALAYKTKILSLAIDRELKLIKEDDERQEAFDQAVERYVEEGMSRELALAEAKKEEEEEAARNSDEQGGSSPTTTGGAVTSATGGGAGGGSPTGGGGGEEDIPGADGRNPTFVLLRGFPQTSDHVVQLAKHGIQLHAAFAVNSLARLGKRDDPSAAATAALGASSTLGSSQNNNKSSSSSSSSPSGGGGGKSEKRGDEKKSGGGGGSGSGGGRKSQSQQNQQNQQNQQQVILSVSSCVRKDVIKVHPFRDHPLRHVHCWLYNVATAEGTRVVDETTGQKERILQESENDVADRVVGEVISVESALNRYRQWIQTKSLPDEQKLLKEKNEREIKEQKEREKEKEEEELAAAAQLAEQQQQQQQQENINSSNKTRKTATPSSSTTPSSSKESHNNQLSPEPSSGGGDMSSSSSSTITKEQKEQKERDEKSNQIKTDRSFVYLQVPKLVDVAAEIHCKNLEEERQRIIDMHRAHEAAMVSEKKGGGAGGSSSSSSSSKLQSSSSSSSSSNRQRGGKQRGEVVDPTAAGLPEIPSVPNPPTSLPITPSLIPHDSSLLRHILETAPVSTATCPEIVVNATISQAAATAGTTTEMQKTGIPIIVGQTTSSSSSQQPSLSFGLSPDSYYSTNQTSSGTQGGGSFSPSSLTPGGTTGISKSASTTHYPALSISGLDTSQTSLHLPATGTQRSSAAQSVADHTETSSSSANHPHNQSTTTGGGAAGAGAGGATGSGNNNGVGVGSSILAQLHNAGVNIPALETKTANDIRDVSDFCDYLFACAEGSCNDEEDALNEIRRRRLGNNQQNVLFQQQEQEQQQQEPKQENDVVDPIFEMVSELDSTRGGNIDPNQILVTNERVGDIISKYNNNINKNQLLNQTFTKSLSVPNVEDVKNLNDLQKYATSMLTERCGFNLEDASNTMSKRNLVRVWNSSETAARLAQITQNPDLTFRICSGYNNNTNNSNNNNNGYLAVVAPGSLEPTSFVPLQERKRFRVTSTFFGGTIPFPEWMARRAYIEKEELFFNPPPSEEEEEELLLEDSDDDEFDDEEYDDDDRYLDHQGEGEGGDNNLEGGGGGGQQGQQQQRRKKKQKVKPPPEYVLFERAQTKELRRRAALELVRGMMQPGVSQQPDVPSQALVAQNHSAFGVYGETSLMLTRDPNTNIRTNITVGASRSVDSFVQSGFFACNNETQGQIVTCSFHATIPSSSSSSSSVSPVEDNNISPFVVYQQQQRKDDLEKGDDDEKTGASSSSSSSSTTTAQHGSSSSTSKTGSRGSGRKQTLTPGGPLPSNKQGENPTTPRVKFASASSSSSHHHHNHPHDGSDGDGGTPRGDGTARSGGGGANSGRYGKQYGGDLPAAPLPSVVRVQSNFSDEATLSACTQPAPVQKRTMENGIVTNYYLSVNHTDDLIQLIPSSSSSSSTPSSSLQVERTSSRRWTRIPVWGEVSTASISFVESREINRIISSCGNVTVKYHNGYSLTMLPNGSTFLSVPASPTATAAATAAAATAAVAANNNNNNEEVNTNENDSKEATSRSSATAAAANVPPLGSSSSSSSSSSSIPTSPPIASATTAAGEAGEQQQQPSGISNNNNNTSYNEKNTCDVFIITSNGTRLLRRAFTDNVTSLGNSRLLSTKTTHPDQLPTGVESREIREDGVVVTNLFDGRTLIEHCDGTQFWTNSNKKNNKNKNNNQNLITVECWPAEPFDFNSQQQQQKYSVDPAKFVSSGPFASPLQLDPNSNSISFVAVRSGDLFVELSPSKLLSTWRPTGQEFNIDIEKCFAHFLAVNPSSSSNNNNNNNKKEQNSIRFVFDLLHGGLRGVDSLPDACPDGPTGLSDPIAFHVTPFGRTRVRKLAEDTHPPLDLDVTRPRQVIEQFAVKNEMIFPPGVVVPEIKARETTSTSSSTARQEEQQQESAIGDTTPKTALHYLQGPPPLPCSNNRSINLSSVTPFIENGGFEAESKKKEFKQQLETFFSSTSSESSSTNESSATSSKFKRGRPMDPSVFYILPDGRALELLRPQEIPHFASAALHSSDGVFSNVFVVNNNQKKEQQRKEKEAEAAVVCSVPPITTSASFAAQNYSYLRPFLSSTLPFTNHLHSSCENNNNTSSSSRTGNGPARSVADFLQRVHTYTSTPAAHSRFFSSSSSSSSSSGSNSGSVEKIVVNTRLFANAENLLSSSSASNPTKEAIEALHNAAHPLTWLEQGDVLPSTTSKKTNQKNFNNASQTRVAGFGVEPVREDQEASKTQKPFMNRIKQHQSRLQSALGDNEANRYFNPSTETGSQIIAKTKAELEEGNWKKLVTPTSSTSTSAREEKKKQAGTRGAGFAHFEAAAEKLMEVGSKSPSSSSISISPKLGGSLPPQQEQEQQKKPHQPSSSSSPHHTKPALWNTKMAPSLSGSILSSSSQQQQQQPGSSSQRKNFVGSSSSGFSSGFDSSQNKNNSSLRGSSSSTKEARLILEPSHIEFAPLHQGLKYQTTVSLINIGSNATRFRAKITTLSGDEFGIKNNTFPRWLHVDVPHVRLGPGMSAPIQLEVSGHQPVGETLVEITVSFEGSASQNQQQHRDTVSTVSTIRITTTEAPGGGGGGAGEKRREEGAAAGLDETTTSSYQHNNQASSSMLLHSQDLCWMTSTGNTVECLGPSSEDFKPGSIKKVDRTQINRKKIDYDAVDDGDSD